MNILRFSILLTLGLWAAWIDIKSRRIPNPILLAIFCISLFAYAFHPKLLIPALLSAIIFSFFLLPIALFRSRSLGAGDVKFIIVLAFLLGRGALVASGLLIASLVGALQILILYVSRRRWPKSIPFAPALLIGALFVAAG
jgi:leader peptidase (prepilin peptidase)/N-methyltransferase